MNKNIAAGFVVLTLILIGAVFFSAYTYTVTLKGKDAEIDALHLQINSIGIQPSPTPSPLPTNQDSQAADLQKQIDQKNAEINSLNQTVIQKTNEIDQLNAVILDKGAQIDNLKKPQLLRVNLKVEDSRPLLGTPSLHIYGALVNIGMEPAYNCKIHVTAYQSGGVVAIDTDIILGTIPGQSWVSVDGSPSYGGKALTSWDLKIEPNEISTGYGQFTRVP